MKIKEIGSRGIVFTFDDLSTPEYESPTNVFAVICSKNIYLCDTFLGPESMKEIKSYFAEKQPNKPFIIFNSHSHWDHHWGNCAFPDSKIIGHELCREKIDDESAEELQKYKDFKRGNIKITPPNLLFKNVLVFEEDELKIFYTPGHTNDSSSLYDQKDQILFPGDNLEHPIPYISTNLDGVKEYIKTLEKYSELELKYIVPGHGQISTRKLLNDNLLYLKAFPELLETKELEKVELSYFHVHLHNLNTLAKISEEEGKKEEAKKYYVKLIDLAQKEQLLKPEGIEEINKKINQL